MSNRWMPEDELGTPVEPGQSFAERLKLHREGLAPLSPPPNYAVGPSPDQPMPPPLPDADGGQPMQSLGHSLDARARLLVEAQAAAVALDKVKRLLEPQVLRELRRLAQEEPQDRASEAQIPAPLPSMFSLVPVAEDRGMFLATTLPYPDPTMHQTAIRGFVFGLALSSLVGAALYILL
jgi:hypothetical protein